MAYVDISTGEFLISETEDLVTFEDELLRIEPRELLLPDDVSGEKVFARLYADKRPPLFIGRGKNDFSFDEACRVLEKRFGAESIQRFVADGYRGALGAAGALLAYLLETQKQMPQHLHGIAAYEVKDFMILDESTLRNLEIVQNWMDRSKRHSLFGVLDDTRTAMGARLMRRWIQYPLLQAERIQNRLDTVEELMENSLDRASLQERFKSIQDLERLNSRISLGVANPRDLLSLKQSLERIPKIKERLAPFQSLRIREILERLDPLEDVTGLLAGALVDEPPITVREGGIFREGYHQELDELRSISRDGKRWIAALEARERERTGISSLKVRYNKVFGYYIEVTKSHLKSVPQDYERKQTLVNAERFTLPDLNEYERKVVGAQERSQELEYELFAEIRGNVAAESLRVRDTAHSLAELDVFASLAEVAVRNHYTRPEMTHSDELVIMEGRHPVIEQANMEERFVPNDAYMDANDNRMVILTGPNMAGKSTYMRQVALIVLMAQMGGFVPAKSARIGLVDRIFTRVGAMDNIIRGMSTFMVEMKETAHILKKASQRSLILLDEIGRGTSTFDGVSIAWAVAEYIDRHIKARTLFATHYHELAELTSKFRSIKNCHVAVKEWGENILFLRKVMEGPSSHSYGIQVARLAGIPSGVIKRAGEILQNLESGQWNDVGQPRLAQSESEKDNPGEEVQLPLFSPAGSAEEEILSLNILEMTPLDALNKLKEIQDRLRNQKG